MRAALLAATLTGVLSGIVTAQTRPLTVSITEGKSRAGLAVVRSDPYTSGGPSAGVPAAPSSSQAVTASGFRVRAWKEATGAARVIVFAVQPRSDGREQETQIDTFVLNADESRTVTTTEKYGARPVTVSAAF
jgi:hypothetical protein